MIEEYLERIKNYRIPEDLDKINREFFLYSAEKGSVYEKITCSGNYGYIRSRMISNVMNSTWKTPHGSSFWSRQNKISCCISSRPLLWKCIASG